ncbi:cytochrome P450 [Streptomyces noursei]|uniref:cytochrome P450 n=1 Tax=Streptomyces noursei TaxID=1971 RepID=UPI0019C46A9B|nr:cytochrome P450 [Streptomyces noursei]MCZ1014123.1 cytochrome P450 [Streptomyces noursei]GGX24303.1 cytochrome P450 [Streptomyces noursei]
MGIARTIPRAPGSLPLLGHALSLRRHPLAFLVSLPAHGDVVRVKLGPAAALVLCDPDLVQKVLLDDRTFDKGGPLIERGREGLGNGLATCPHGDHRRQRRLTQQAFQTQRMPAYAQMMSKQIAEAVGRWGDGDIVDVLTAMQTITARTTLATMFADTSDASLTDLLADFNVFSRGVYKRMFMPPPLHKLPTPGNRRYHQARARLRQAIGSVIENHQARDDNSGDLLSILLAASDDGQGLSDAEITDQVMSFLYAGIETTAAVLAWALHQLAQHPDLEARLHTEVDAVMPKGAPATFDLLPQLQFTNRIITETLRLHPPGWMLTRIATTDTQLAGYPVEKGTTIVYSPYLIHHQAALYPDPERFDPDRWNGRTTRGRNSALIPFGGGTRKCIGDTFGLTEAALTLATITAQWRLEPTPGATVRPVPGLILNPHGLAMRITARTTSNPAAPRST